MHSNTSPGAFLRLAHNQPRRICSLMIDLDGTLLDTLPDFEIAFQQVFEALHLPAPDTETIQNALGKGSEHLVRTLLAHVTHSCADGAEVDQLFSRAWPLYLARYAEVNGRHARVYPGVEEGLRLFQKAGLSMVCLTNKPLQFALPVLHDKGLASYFLHVYGGESFARKKPDPLPLLQACKALATVPANTLMVGDSNNDAQAARAAGCPIVLLTYGYNHGQPLDAVDADAFAHSMLDIAQRLLR